MKLVVIVFFIFLYTHFQTTVAVAQIDFPGNRIDKAGYRLEFNDEFQGTQIDSTKWFPFYLPQWSSRDRSKAQYDQVNGNLILKITEEQSPWCPEFNGGVKCSSFQTGVYAGEYGSKNGQHRFNPDCMVREEQEELRLYTTLYGYIEIRAKAVASSNNVVAFWMIGFEDTPGKSGEICIMEVKGKNIEGGKFTNGYGVHPFSDPNLRDEFYQDRFTGDATGYNIYAIEWKPDRIEFLFNNKKVRTIYQSPGYEMQFMLNVYEIPVADEFTRSKGGYPTIFEIDYVRAYKPENGY